MERSKTMAVRDATTPCTASCVVGAALALRRAGHPRDMSTCISYKRKVDNGP